MVASAAEFARLAVELCRGSTIAETVESVAGYAVQAVECDFVGVTAVRRQREMEPLVVTDPLVEQMHRLELELEEGPCLAALREGDPSSLVADTKRDTQWPRWSLRAAELGVGSVLSHRLTIDGSPLGALNLFAKRTDAFDEDDLAVADILARHASVAIAAAREEANLWRAIDARKRIGQAQGILMERFDLNEDQAFAVLRRYSQDHNIKLHDVAMQLLETRRLPENRKA